MRDYIQEIYYSQNRKDIAIVSTESYIKKIKLSNLENKILIIGDLKCNCPLVFGKD